MAGCGLARFRPLLKGMVKLFFGLPGCGKTTLIASFAKYWCKRIGRPRAYGHVYSNVAMNIPGLTVIDDDCIGKYDLSNSLILIDEATLFADSRDFKSFSKARVSFFLLHRHYHCDIFLFTQQWDGVDRKIRVITDRVYYVYKTPFFGHWFSCYYRIPYSIIIPDPRRGGDKLGEIVQGYCKPSFFQRIFATKRIFRPFYYRFFDSFEAPPLPPLPSRFCPVPAFGVASDCSCPDSLPSDPLTVSDSSTSSDAAAVSDEDKPSGVDLLLNTKITF